MKVSSLQSEKYFPLSWFLLVRFVGCWLVDKASRWTVVWAPWLGFFPRMIPRIFMVRTTALELWSNMLVRTRPVIMEIKLQWTPLNGITLGRTIADLINWMITISKRASTYSIISIIWDLSVWINLITLTDWNHYLWSH